MRLGKGVWHEHGLFPAYRWASERFNTSTGPCLTPTHILAPMVPPPSLGWISLAQSGP